MLFNVSYTEYMHILIFSYLIYLVDMYKVSGINILNHDDINKMVTTVDIVMDEMTVSDVSNLTGILPGDFRFLAHLKLTSDVLRT